MSHKSSYTIEGNAFGGWVEPGLVWFQEDRNGNNLPDEVWYGPAASGAWGEDAGLSHRYSVTFFKHGDAGVVNEYGQTIREIYWVDCRGRTGEIPGGWPWESGVSNASGAWVTYTGTLVWDDGVVKSADYTSYGYQLRRRYRLQHLSAQRRPRRRRQQRYPDQGALHQGPDRPVQIRRGLWGDLDGDHQGAVRKQFENESPADFI